MPWFCGGRRDTRPEAAGPAAFDEPTLSPRRGRAAASAVGARGDASRAEKKESRLAESRLADARLDDVSVVVPRAVAAQRTPRRNGPSPGKAPRDAPAATPPQSVSVVPSEATPSRSAKATPRLSILQRLEGLCNSEEPTSRGRRSARRQSQHSPEQEPDYELTLHFDETGDAPRSEAWPATGGNRRLSGDFAPAPAPAPVVEPTAVRVVIRARPSRGEACCVLDGDKVTMGATRAFGPFDAVLGERADQEAVYIAVAQPVVSRVLRGFNGCVMAYGATGSGKTHSIVGTREEPGLVDRCLRELFSAVDDEANEVETTCECTFIELYLDGICDLLAKDEENDLRPKALRANSPQKGDASPRPQSQRKRKAVPAPTIREDAALGGRGVFLDGAVRRDCHSADDAQKALRDGTRRRTTRGTALNDKSSRSHAVFTLEFERQIKSQDGCAPRVRAKFHLVDLAGSERLAQAQTVDQGVKESCAINASLSALGNVVAALTNVKATHVPYRDSKLTRLLQDSLGGNSYTTMLCCVGAAPAEAQHTLSTLRFAARAKNISLKPTVNMDPRDAEIARLRAENAQLKDHILRLQR